MTDISLSAEQINEFLSKAVLESQIGEAVKASVKRSIEQLSRTYDNPFDAVIKQHISNLVREELATTHADTFREKVANKLSEKITDEFIANVVDAAYRKYD